MNCYAHYCLQVRGERRDVAKAICSLEEKTLWDGSFDLFWDQLRVALDDLDLFSESRPDEIMVYRLETEEMENWRTYDVEVKTISALNPDVCFVVKAEDGEGTLWKIYRKGLITYTRRIEACNTYGKFAAS